MENKKVGLIGCGAMGSALIEGFSKVISGQNIFLYDVNEQSSQKLASKLQANVCTNPSDLVSKNCDYIILAVKPYIVKDALANLFSETTNWNGTIVSVAAGVSLQDLELCLPENINGVSFIRLMPNTACLVGQGMIGLSCSDAIDVNTIENVTTLLKTTGLVERVPENQLDAVTALSGSGIAYGFMFIEALADAGVQFGMTRKQAYIYAAQMLKGASSMVLETETHPAVLKDQVCSPGGITIAALQTLEEKGFRGSIIAAAKTAWEFSIKMGKK